MDSAASPALDPERPAAPRHGVTLDLLGRGLGVSAGVVAIVFGPRLFAAPNPVVWIHPVLGAVAVVAALWRPRWLLGLGVLSFLAYGWYLVLNPMPVRLVGMAGVAYVVSGVLTHRARHGMHD